MDTNGVSSLPSATTADHYTSMKNSNGSTQHEGTEPRQRKVKLVPTITKHDLPLIFHEPHVETGFRQTDQPWLYYALSLFQVHNECMNVWTHLVAFILVVYRAWQFQQEFDLLRDPYLWPLGAEFLTTFLLYAFSAGAHCFSNKSELVHYTCFIIDYAGIGLYGLGSSIAHYWYCLHEDVVGTLPHQWAAPGGVILSSLVCFCCSVSKAFYKRPYPFTRRLWQMCSVLAIYSWLIFPIVYQQYMYLFHNHWEPSLPQHTLQMFWFFLGGFFFGSDIPQRFCPGWCDFVGHSHQIFHVCIMFTSLTQLDALYKDIKADRAQLYASHPPTFWGTYGAVFIGIAINFFIGLCFYFTVKKRLEREKQK